MREHLTTQFIELAKQADNPHLIDASASYEVSIVEMDKDEFISIFKVRFENNQLMGISIAGFQELITNPHLAAVDSVKCIYLENFKDNFGIFTDESCQTLLGVIDFNNVVIKRQE